MRVITLLISYKNIEWMSTCVNAFQHHLPGQDLLIIDNNPTITESNYLHKFAKRHRLKVEKTLNPGCPHGTAIDYALTLCQEYTHLMHIEPDCLIEGRQWFDNMCDVMDENWMSGMVDFPGGYIHVTPTLWQIDKVPGTFLPSHNGGEFTGLEKIDIEKHIRKWASRITQKDIIKMYEIRVGSFSREYLNHAFQAAGIKRDIHDFEDPDFSMKKLDEVFNSEMFKHIYTIAYDCCNLFWDTGWKNWYDCHKEGKAKLVDFTGDFWHFFFGSRGSAESRYSFPISVLENPVSLKIVRKYKSLPNFRVF